MMHGECEHVLYERVLLGDPAVNLKNPSCVSGEAARAKKVQKVSKAPAGGKERADSGTKRGCKSPNIAEVHIPIMSILHADHVFHHA